MPTNAENATALLESQIGQTVGSGEWMTVDQDRIDAFADVTDDHQFIHVDPELAKNTPFGTTIAHGFLTLSLLTPLCASIQGDPALLTGVVMGVNYGFDKVRFVAPVKVNSKIRATAVVAGVVTKGNAVDMTRTITVEIEGESKPALVADWVTRLVYS